MRFLQTEYEDLKRELESQGFSVTDFLFTKRRGRLHVQHENYALPFSFFRKKSTRLTAQGKWEDHLTYFILDAGKEAEVNGWEGVLEAFSRWLKGS